MQGKVFARKRQGYVMLIVCVEIPSMADFCEVLKTQSPLNAI